MAVTIVIVSDSHIGSSVGLCKPAAALDDGGTYGLSARQSFLWRSYEDFLARVERERADVYTVWNGDIGEGDYKNRSTQVISRNKSTITRWMSDIFEPLANLSAVRFVTRGTEAHVGASAELEEGFADDIDATPEPATGASSWYWLPLEVEGVCLDIRHQPTGGGGAGQPQNSQSVVDRLASRTLFSYANLGRRPPDIVVCSHLHHWLDSRDAFRTRAIITPCWTLKTGYVWRVVDPVQPSDIGGVMIRVSAGHYEIEPFRYQPAATPYYSIGAASGHYRQPDNRS